jgi:hypothetical protein
MPELINLPDDLSCIHPFFLTGAISLAGAIVAYLIKVVREKDKKIHDAILNHMSDLKENSQNIQSISDKKTNLVLQNLENQITKLEIILSKSK